MKKKIIHVVNSKIYSGLEKVAIEIIEKLNDEYDFYYACQDGDILRILKQNNIKRIKLNAINRKEIKRLEKEYKPDIVHAHDYRTSLNCGLYLEKTPIISHLHNNPPWLQKKMHPYNYILLKALLSKNIKKIWTVSNSIENEYIFSTFIKPKMECIGNPLSREKIVRCGKDNNYSKKYDICCVARITAQKNPMKFVEIIKELKKSIPEIRAIWVGDGELRQQMKKKIEEDKLEENIELTGFKSNPYKYMSQSKVFMLTSDWEGFGLVAFEALTLGVPCIVNGVGGLTEIVDDKCGKLCNNKDITSYITEIVRLLTDKEYYLKKKDTALKKAAHMDNSEDYYLKIDETYKKILNKQYVEG